MKHSKLLLVLFLGVLSISVTFAQKKTKAEKKAEKREMKEWKKKLGKLTVEEFKSLSEENDRLKSENQEMSGQFNGLKRQVTSKENQLSSLQTQMNQTQAAYQACQSELETLRVQPIPVYNPADSDEEEEYNTGLVFRVQVGAFRKMDLDKYAKTSKEFSEEEEQDLRKYVLGNFRSYEEANVLKRYLREMGLKDAWITSYMDGKRVPLKEVIPKTVKLGRSY